MKKIKIIIISILVIIILLLILLFIIKKKNVNNVEQDIIDLSQADSDEFDIVDKSEKLIYVNDKSDYYETESLTLLYINALIENDSETIMNILDNNYIEQYGINIENVVERLDIYSDGQFKDKENRTEYFEKIIDKIYVAENGDIETYFVFGKIINKDNGNIKSFTIMIEIQVSEDNFYILPENYVIENNLNNIKVGDTYYSKINSIESNDFNSYDYGEDEVEESTIRIDRMNKLIKKMIFDTEDSYNLFTEEYRNKRFGSYENYRNYINENVSQLMGSVIKKYKITDYDGYTEYDYIDQYNNHYIFDESTIMNFTVKLDNYTINSKKFITEYNNLSDKEKVKKNINKIIAALNRKDYDYLYNKLDENFRNSNFVTINDFKSYLQNNFYEYNRADYKDYIEDGDTNILNVDIVDLENEENNQNINISIILQDEQEFKFYFSM